MNTRLKKIYTALAASFLLAIVFFAFNLPTAHAAGAPRPEDIGLDSLSDACASGFGGYSPVPKNISLCANYVAAQIGYSVVWMVSWLLWAVAKLFNIVLVVQNGAFYDQPMVNTGWKIARDVANIFYIFFLLIISIAMILRYESYGSKKLLWNLIISALLVNFSLPLAGLIIDFSNALGNTFYINMSTSEDADTGSFVKNSDGATQKTLDISTTLISGFQPSKLLVKDPNVTKLDQQDTKSLLLNILLAEILAIVLIVVVSIVLIAAMILLIARIVTLWFVLILAPLAFLAWVLPQTSGRASEWFETLFKQSFFYPAFMFTLYISITAVKYGVVAKMISADENGLAGAMFSTSAFAASGASFFTQKIQLILNFVILTMFMGGGLIVAQKMSAAGAGIAMKTSNSLSKSARGYAGRMTNAPLAALSEKALSKSAGISNARILGIPVGRAVGQALRPAALSVQKRAADRAKEVDAQAARVKNLAPAASAAMLGSMNARGRAKAFDTMDEKQRARVIQQMNSPQQVAFAKNIHATDPNKDYARQVAIASGSIASAMEILHGTPRPNDGASDVEKKEYQDNVDKYVKGLGEKDLAKLRADSVDDIYFQRAAIKNGVDTEKLQNSSDVIDPEARKSFESLTREINKVTGAVKIMTDLDEPTETIPPPPKEPVAPKQSDFALPEMYAQAQQEYAEKKVQYQKDLDEYNKTNAPLKEKHDKYREEMSEYVAKYVTEKKLEKVNKETLKTSPAFQDMMVEEMTGTDVRRMAKDREGAAAIKEAFKGYANRKFNLDIDKDWDQVAVKIAADDGGKNKALGKWMQQNMGAKAIIQQGRAASRRDLQSNTPTTSTPSGNSNEINPTPPAPSPTKPSGTGTV